MSERLAQLEEMMRATEDALSSIRDGSPERIDLASQRCTTAFEACRDSMQGDSLEQLDPQEFDLLRHAWLRLRELTQVSLQEAAQARTALAGEQRRAGSVRHFLHAAQIATESAPSDFDHEG